MNYSLIIGIEDFADPKIPKVEYATNDANAIAAAFKEFGFDEAHQVVLPNEKATRNTVEYQLKQILKCSLQDDSVLIFFSGHGCSVAGQSYLVCHDSHHNDFAGTSIAIREIFELMDSTRCRKVILLLDCCHAGLQFPKQEKSAIANMTDAEIKAFFDASDYRVAFASCADTESSFWSDRLGHGVWTYVLLQALTGKVRQILESGRYLRAAQLQDYLFNQVPVTLRETRTERSIQTPRFYGSVSNNFLVADLAALLAKNAKGIEEIDPLLKDVSFCDVAEGRVKDLPDFDKGKGHKVYDSYTASTQAFVSQIGQGKIEERANELYKKIKTAFGYIRQDIRVDTSGSTATIKAKDFDVDLELHQSESDPSGYIETLSVSNFLSGEVMMTEIFNKVFAREISALRLEFSASKDIVAFIDQVEQANDSRMKIKYPSDNSYCSFSIYGVDACFVLRPMSLSVELPGKQPRQMVQALIQASKAALLDAANVALLPPDPDIIKA